MLGLAPAQAVSCKAPASARLNVFLLLELLCTEPFYHLAVRKETPACFEEEQDPKVTAEYYKRTA